MTISLPDLPYPSTALEPFISEKTLQFHHGKHHKTYVDNTLKLLAGTDLQNAELEEIIKKTVKDDKKVSIFNNAGLEPFILLEVSETGRWRKTIRKGCRINSGQFRRL